MSKRLLSIIVLIFISSPTFAKDICTVTKSEPFSTITDPTTGKPAVAFENIELRIDKVNSTTSEWTKILIPKVAIPLQENTQYELKPSFANDPAYLTYSKGILKYDYKNHSNFTNDITTIEISPDLSVVGEITYLRQGLGLAGLMNLIMEDEGFSCIGSAIVQAQ